MAHIFQRRLIQVCTAFCISPDHPRRSQGDTEKCAHWYSRTCVPGLHSKGFRAGCSEPRALPSLFLPSQGLCIYSAGVLAFGSRVAGSRGFSMLSLRDALDFSGSLVLCRTGPSVSESEQGQAAKASSSQRQGS